MDWGGKIRKITKFIEHLFKNFLCGEKFLYVSKIIYFGNTIQNFTKYWQKKKTANEESLEMNLDRF